MSGPPKLPPRGYGKLPIDSPRPSRPPAGRPPAPRRPLPAHDTKPPPIPPSTSKPSGPPLPPVKKPSYDMDLSHIFWTERVAKLPIIDTKIDADKKNCSVNDDFILARHPESLNDLRRDNKSFDGFYKDFIEVNEKYRTYSQAKKIQLLLLYYIKKYNSRDVPHARDCYNYIIALNDQKKWLSPLDLDFVYGFAFNNQVFVIINTLMNEELNLNPSLINEDPLMYGFKNCNNEILLWLVKNVLLNVNVKQFKFVYDIIQNKRKCFSLEVVDSYKFLYNQLDDNIYKSIDLAISRGDINQFNKIIMGLDNTKSKILDTINRYIFSKYQWKAFPFSREIFRIYGNYNLSNWANPVLLNVMNYLLANNDDENIKPEIQKYMEFLVEVITRYQPDYMTNFLIPKIIRINNLGIDSQHEFVTYWMPRIKMIIDIIIEIQPSYLIRTLLPTLIEKIIVEESSINLGGGDILRTKVKLNKIDFYWVEYIIDNTRFTRDEYDTLIKESISSINVDKNNSATQYLKLLIKQKLNPNCCTQS